MEVARHQAAHTTGVVSVRLGDRAAELSVCSALTMALIQTVKDTWPRRVHFAFARFACALSVQYEEISNLALAITR
jgi:hypothetical protein